MYRLREAMGANIPQPDRLADMPQLPPDRSHVTTEIPHPGSSDLGALETSAAVALMIDEQRAVADALEMAMPALVSFVDDLASRMKGGGRLIYIGAGTSGRLGVLDASECPPTFMSSPDQVLGIIAGGDSSLRVSSEGMEDDPYGSEEVLADIELNGSDTLLGIAAGGTTPYVLGALPRAKKAGAMTGLLTCAESVTSVDSCDHLIVIPTGPEVLRGSTRLKAGSATKVALNMITTIAFVRLGKVHRDLMIDIRCTNEKLADRAIRILKELRPDLSRSDAHAKLQACGGSLKQALSETNQSLER